MAMTKEQLDNYKKNLEQMRTNEEAKQMEDRAMLQGSPEALVPSKRTAKFEGKEGSIKIYEDWLKKYKEKNPGFQEDKNTYRISENGEGCIHFSDPEAEEDFVRCLAANSPHGGILDKGIQIANFEDGKLIDMRTGQEFPEGEYAKLVQQLDLGIAYSDIPSPESTAPTPFRTNS